MRRILFGSLAASAAVATLLIGSATGASASHTVDIGDTGTVVAKGAGVVVPVTVTCQPNPFPFPFPFPGSGGTVSVTANQRSGNKIAQGMGSAQVVCDGTAQTVEVQLTANEAPFKNGTALVTASMPICDFSGCHVATDSAEVQLKK